MSDDIVTRLRERAIVLFSNGADGNAFIDEHAADEIERLRADNEELLEIAKNFANNGRCDVYEQEWGMCLHANCEWHNTEHAWETYCMRRGL